MNYKVYEHSSIVTHSAVLLSTKLATELLKLNSVFIMQKLAILKSKLELEAETTAGPINWATEVEN